ncbi:MAG TPA: FAD-dependent oxidoreductase [Rhodanobacteraceae bacterium]|nr:FAD-dependent oxidoreductase [Rhodanobacteraceae bacterium]
MQVSHDYLIVGGGMSGEAAAQAIRATDPSGRIGLIGAENHPPYDRPPLSKALWKDASEDSIWRPIEKSGANIYLGQRVVSIDADAHTLRDDHDNVHEYRKLLLATGGTPRRLAIPGDRVLAFRGIDDYRRLRELAQPDAHIAVVGGGFIGCELAAALVATGCRVTMLFPEAVLGERVYSDGLSDFLDHYYREHGVDVRAGHRVEGGAQTAARVRLDLDDGSTLEADAVVAGLGIVPDTALAESIGATVGNGIHVDECMRTSVADVFAAGDVANFPNQALGRLRVEHENAAIATGHCAGLAMAGKPAPYTELPFFYSDLFDLGYEAVGRLDSRLDIAEDWITPYREGVVYYLDDGRVRGVLLWNTWGQVEAARALIADPARHDADSLRGRIRG